MDNIELREQIKSDLQRIEKLITDFHTTNKEDHERYNKTIWGVNGNDGHDVRIKLNETSLKFIKRVGWLVMSALAGVISWLVRGAIV